MTPRVAVLLSVLAPSAAQGGYYGYYDSYYNGSSSTYGGTYFWSSDVGPRGTYGGSYETGSPGDGGLPGGEEPVDTDAIDYGFGREEGGCATGAPMVGWAAVLAAVLISGWSRGRHPIVPRGG